MAKLHSRRWWREKRQREQAKRDEIKAARKLIEQGTSTSPRLMAWQSFVKAVVRNEHWMARIEVVDGKAQQP